MLPILLENVAALLRRSNLQDVAFSGGELVVDSVLDVDNVETSIVTLTVSDNTDTTLSSSVFCSPHKIHCTYHVTTTSHHGDDTSVELDEVGDLASAEVNLDCVVDLDGRVGVADPRRRSVPIET